MPLSVRASGSWRQARNVFVRVSGTWRQAKSVFVRQGGTWREIWTSIVRATRGLMLGTNSTWTKYSNHVELYAQDTTWDGGGLSTLVTTIPVDLTGVTNVQIDWESEKNSTTESDAIFIVSTSQMGGGNTYNARWYSGQPFSRQITSLNVSSLSGLYYIRAHASTNAGPGQQWTRVRVYRLLLDGQEIWNASSPGSTV